MKGYRVRYTLTTKLVDELVEAADGKQLNGGVLAGPPQPDGPVHATAGQILEDEADDGALNDGQRAVVVEPGGPPGEPGVDRKRGPVCCRLGPAGTGPERSRNRCGGRC